MVRTDTINASNSRKVSAATRKLMTGTAALAILGTGVLALPQQAQAAECVLDIDGNGTADGTGGASTQGTADSPDEENLACGEGASVTGTASTAIGASATVNGQGATALGAGAFADQNDTTALGRSATAQGFASTAVGAYSSATGEQSSALGSGAFANSFSTALGASSNANNGSVAVGQASVSTGQSSTALGANSSALGERSTALGHLASTSGVSAASVAIGLSAAAGSPDDTPTYGAVAIGPNSVAQATNSVALGNISRAQAEGALAIGTNTTANQANTVSIGTSSAAIGVNSVAIGESAFAVQTNTLALGVGSIGGHDNSVALGANSETGDVNVVSVGRAFSDGGTPDDTSDDVAAITRRITNVADGTQAGDAVNLAQLNEAVANAGGGTGGEFLAGDNTSGRAAASAVGADSLALGAGSVAARSNAVSVGSAFDDNGTPDDTSDDTAALNRQITNVAAGTEATDAVNVAQLAAVEDDVAANGEAITSVNESFDEGVDNGRIAPALARGYDSLAVGRGTVADSNGTAVGYEASSAGDGVAVGYVASAQQQSVAVGRQAEASGLAAISIGTFSTAEGIGATSIGYLTRANAEDSVAIGYGSTANEQSTVSFGSAGATIGPATRRLVNVTAGRDDTDAVNVAQLNEAVGNVSGGGGGEFLAGDNTSGRIAASVTGADSLALGAGSVAARGEVVSVGRAFDDNGTPDDASDDTTAIARQITNIAAGTEAGDAVNVAQLSEVETTVTQNSENLRGLDVDLTNINPGGAGGAEAQATRPAAVALGVDSVASGDLSLALGAQSVSASLGSIALGRNARSTGRDAIAIGQVTNASGSQSIILGYNGAALSDDAIAIGAKARVSAPSAVAIGANSRAVEQSTVSFGNAGATSGPATRRLVNVTAGRDDTDAVNVAQLNEAVANVSGSGGEEFLAGDNTSGRTAASVTGADSLALGAGSIAARSNAVSVGSAFDDNGTPDDTSDDTATLNRQITNVASGTEATDAVNVAQLAGVQDDVASNGEAIGSVGAIAEENAAKVAFFDVNHESEPPASATGFNGIAIGAVSEAFGLRGIAVGYASRADNYAVAVGTFAQAGDRGTAVGDSASAQADGSVALGARANADHSSSVAIGLFSQTTASNTVSFGRPFDDRGTVDTDDDLDLITRRLTFVSEGIDGTDAVNVDQLNAAISGAVTDGVAADGAFLAGTNPNGLADATATGENSVALGAGSIAARANTISVGSAFDDNGTPDDTSDDTAAFNRQITNVAAGTEATDAVNFGQLQAVDDRVTAVDGRVSALATDFAGVENLAVANASNLAEVEAQAGRNAAELAFFAADGSDFMGPPPPATVTGTFGTAAGAGASAGSFSTAFGTLSAAESNSVAIGFEAEANNTNAVAIGSGSQTVADNTVSFGRAPNDDDMEGITRRLTFVADGIDATDAVNVQQLNDAVAGAGTPYLEVNSTDIVASATGTDASALGPRTIASGQEATAVGYRSEATNAAASAFGRGAKAGGLNATAVGSGANASGGGATSLGLAANASANRSTAVGRLSTASKADATSVGHRAAATGIGSTALGNGASASFTNSTAVGSGATTTANNQVVLGGTGSSVVVADIDRSTAAQVGPVDVVTVDANGTLGRQQVATSGQLRSVEVTVDHIAAVTDAQFGALSGEVQMLGGRVDQIESTLVLLDERIASSTATSVAMSGAVFLPNQRFNLTANVGTYDGAHAGAFQIGALVNENVAVNAGLATGFNKNGKTAGRVGVTFGF